MVADCGDSCQYAGITHIHSDMAHDAGMVRKTDIFALVMNTIGLDGALGSRSRFFVDNECALDVDLDSTGIGNGVQTDGTGIRGFEDMPRAGSIKVRRGAFGGRHGGRAREGQVNGKNAISQEFKQKTLNNNGDSVEVAILGGMG